MPNSPRPKIAFLASTLAVGGAERHAAALARFLASRGYGVAVYLWRRRGAVGDELAREGFPVTENLLGRPLRWPGARAELRAAGLLVALDHNDVVRSLPLITRGRPPYIVLNHVQERPPRAWRRPLAAAYAVVAVAESQRPFLAAVAGKITVIPNGVAVPPPPSPEEKRRARERLGVPADAVIVGAVARLAPEKGVDVLLEAMTLAAEARRPYLVIAGDGPERPRLEAFARARLAPAGYKFVGEMADVTPVYLAADIFVLPSRRECAPFALLEAMAHGLPPLAAAAGDIPYIFEGGAGVTFTPGSAAELARALEGLTTDAAARAALGARARAAVAARYDRARMLAAYERLIAQALGTGEETS